jgi:PKD repeat protein
MYTTKKFLSLKMLISGCFSCITGLSLHAQAPEGTSSSNYVFSTISQGTDVGSNSFTKDLNGNTYSMPGTVLRGANKQNENSGSYLQPCYPDPSCSYAPIGFDFYFMGTWAREFIINTEGIFGLPAYANGSINSEINGGCKRIGEPDQTPTGAETRIAPFTGWYARTAPSSGQVTYRTIGSAPFRTLVVEWKDIDFRNNPANPGTDLSSFQLKLYETTNKIDFVYGQMRVGTAGTYQSGFSFGTGDGQMATIEGLTGSNPVVNTQAPASASNIMMNPVTALNSPDGDGKRREFVFDPFTGTSNTAPTDLQAINAAGGVELSWTDAPNEIAYDIYWSVNPLVPLDFTSGHLSLAAGVTDYTIGTLNVTPSANLTQGSTQVSFGNVPLDNLWVGALLSGSGLEEGTTVSSINFTSNTIVISKPVLAGGQVQLTARLNPQTLHYIKVFARREALSAPTTAEVFTGTCIPPEAAFGFEAVDGYTVQFTNQSSGQGVYAWDFGDGNNSAAESPQHIFPGPGNYPVKLVISNACGKDSITIQVIVEPLFLQSAKKETTFRYDPVSARFLFSGQTGYFEIWGIDGKRIQSSVYTAGQTISAESLPPGIYIIRLGNGYSERISIIR